eukprot:285872_1
MAARRSSSRIKKLHNLCVGKTTFSEIILAFNVFVPHWDTQKKKRVQAGLEQIFGDLNDVFCYLEHLIIATQDAKKHMEMIDAVLKRIKSHQMKIRLEKSKFAFNCFEYDGAKISEKGITTTNHKSDQIAWFMNIDNDLLQLEYIHNNDPNDIDLPKKSRLPTISSIQQVKKILNENKFEFQLIDHLPTESQMQTSIVYSIKRKYIPNQIMEQILKLDPRFNQISGLLKYKHRTLEFIPGELTKLKLVNWLNPCKECIICYEDIDCSPLSENKRGVICCGECGVRLCNVCTLQLCFKNFNLENNKDYITNFSCPNCGFDKTGVFIPEFCVQMIEDKFLNEFEEKEQQLIHSLAKKAPQYQSVCNKNKNKKKNDNKTKDSYCAFCTKKLNKPTKQRQHCKTCKKVFYCRAKCKRLHYKQHQKQCPK